jgi:hypothetical protein
LADETGTLAGSYGLSNTLTNPISSTTTMEGLTNPSLMAGHFRHVQMVGVGFCSYGAFSDTEWDDDTCTGGFGGGYYIGPASSNSGTAANEVNGGRIEEQCNNSPGAGNTQWMGGWSGCAGIVFDGTNGGSGTDYVNNLLVQFGRGSAVYTLGTNGPITLTGDIFEGNISTASTMPSAQIVLGGTVNGIHFVNTNVGEANYAYATTAQYFAATDTGATVNNFTFDGGDAILNTGYSVGLYNFTNGTPAGYRVSSAQNAFVDTTQTTLSSNFNGAIGLTTSNAHSGTILDALGATGTSRSSIGLPVDTTTNRPTSPTNGMVRYNSTLGAVEGYITGAWQSFATQGYVNSVPPLPNYIGGLTLLNDTTTPNSVIDIKQGAASSDDYSTLITLAAPYTKTTGSWVVGSGNGCLDAGTIANSTWYNVFVIENTATPVVDVLCSTSAISPLLPTGYTVQRRLDCGFETNSSANIQPFYSVGNPAKCLYGRTQQTLDFNVALADTSTHLETLNVPTGINVRPIGRYSMSGNAVLVSSPNVGLLAPTTTYPFTGAPGFSALLASTTGNINTDLPYVVTNTSGQIALQATASTTTVAETTIGFEELHQPTSGVLALDGTSTGGSSSAIGATTTLTTSNGHDGIFVLVNERQSSTSMSVSGISDGASLSWTKRKSIFCDASQAGVELWYATTPTALSSDGIALSFTSTGAIGVLAFGVSGINTSKIFDSNASLPAAVGENSPTSPVTTTISTNHAYDMLISAARIDGGSSLVGPSGFSSLGSFPLPGGGGGGSTNAAGAEYDIVSALQSSAAISYSWTNAGNYGACMITDAILAGGP